jgi:hypothetical protein
MEFFRLYRVQTGSGILLASYPTSTGSSFPGGEMAGESTDHSPPPSTEIKNAWSYTFTPPYVFMEWCLIEQEVHRDNFTFTVKSLERFLQ